jgi:hypothetical protein
LAIVLACLAGGCSSVPSGASSSSADDADPAKIQLRNNAASLLRDLLDDEKNVSKVFLVKNGRDSAPLVKLIAATADANEKRLDQLAQADPQLNLQALELPPGEKAAREAVAKSKEHDLLFSSGANFEFNLLLTQAEAQNYGWHLALVAAQNSSRPEEVKAFAIISDAMKLLYQQTVSEMRSLPAR